MFCGTLVVTNRRVVRWKDINICEIKRNTSFISNHNVRVVCLDKCLKSYSFSFALYTVYIYDCNLDSVCSGLWLSTHVGGSVVLWVHWKIGAFTATRVESAAASTRTRIGHVQVSIVSLRKYALYWEGVTPQHLMCTKESQLSQPSARWSLAIGGWQVMHWNLMGPGLSSISPLSTITSKNRVHCLSLSEVTFHGLAYGRPLVRANLLTLKRFDDSSTVLTFCGR